MCLVPRPLAFFSMGRNQFSRSLPVGSCSLFLAACCLAVSVSLAPSSNLLAVAVGMVGGLRSRTAVGNFWRNERHGVFWENALPPPSRWNSALAHYKKSFFFSVGQLPFLRTAALGCLMTGNIAVGVALLVEVGGVCSQQTFVHLNGWDEAAISTKEHTQSRQRMVADETIPHPPLAHPPSTTDGGVEHQTEADVEPSMRSCHPQP